MRGTDKADKSVSLYRTNIWRKNGWWPLFTWLLDVTVVNSWLLHQQDAHPDTSLLDFRRVIAVAPIQSELSCRERGVGHPSLSASQSELHFDRKDHLTEVAQQGQKCARQGCTSCPSSVCGKCKVQQCQDIVWPSTLEEQMISTPIEAGQECLIHIKYFMFICPEHKGGNWCEYNDMVTLCLGRMAILAGEKKINRFYMSFEQRSHVSFPSLRHMAGGPRKYCRDYEAFFF